MVAAGLWPLGSLFYHNTQYSQWGLFTNLLWCDILRNKAPQTGPRLTQCARSLAARLTQMVVEFGG